MHCVQVRFSSLLHNVKVTQFYMCNTVMHRIHREVETASKKSSCMLCAAWKSARGCAVNHLLKKQNYGRLSLSEHYDHKPEPTTDSTFQTVSSLEHNLKGGKNETVFPPLRLWYRNAASPPQMLYIICNSADTMCCCCC